MIKELSPKEFKDLIDNQEEFELIDVRTQEEYQIVNLGGTLIPLDEISSRYHEINANKKIIILCHHGRRSLMAANLLESLEIDNIYNLTGGIDKYAEIIDKNLVRY